MMLTGSGSDGAAGLKAIKEAGGTTLGQDPQTCEIGSMPPSAINTGDAEEPKGRRKREGRRGGRRNV